MATLPPDMHGFLHDLRSLRRDDGDGAGEKDENVAEREEEGFQETIVTRHLLVGEKVLLKQRDFLLLGREGLDDADPGEVVVQAIDDLGFRVVRGAIGFADFFDEEEAEDEKGDHEDERREGQNDVDLEQDDEAEDEHP